MYLLRDKKDSLSNIYQLFKIRISNKILLNLLNRENGDV
jgi:hypothetical protein